MSGGLGGTGHGFIAETFGKIDSSARATKKLIEVATGVLKNKKPKKEPTIPEVPTTEERAKSITDTARQSRLKKRAKTGRQSTILTTPLGLIGKANIERKSLLGQ